MKVNVRCVHVSPRPFANLEMSEAYYYISKALIIAKNMTTEHIEIRCKYCKLISVPGLALLDVQIQQWGTGGPQLMLLKWV